MTSRTFFGYDLEENRTYPVEIEIYEPRQCMHCNQTGVQTFITGIKTVGKHDEFSSISLYTCPLCGSTTTHFSIHWDPEEMQIDYDGHQSHKTMPSKKTKPEYISNYFQVEFPDFTNIYLQAEQAQEAGLDQIAGMGYRKALEFLVTDYLMKFPVDGIDQEWLTSPKTTLGNKISKIPGNRIQVLAKAISYLGNDETHYSKQHPEHDIDSIKAFIRVLVSEIDNEIEFQRAEALINKPRS